MGDGERCGGCREKWDGGIDGRWGMEGEMGMEEEMGDGGIDGG